MGKEILNYCSVPFMEYQLSFGSRPFSYCFCNFQCSGYGVSVRLWWLSEWFVNAWYRWSNRETTSCSQPVPAQ